MFSKVWTNSDEFAYVIFETMNDRGLSLTQIEMIRSYLLSCIDLSDRDNAMILFDNIVKKLVNVKTTSKYKAEFDFFKIYLRGHYANDLSQGKNSKSDFTRIGNEFHRWVRDNSKLIGLNVSKDYLIFVKKFEYFASVYIKINELIGYRDCKKYLYLIVNHDYGFTLQNALILSSIAYLDDDETVVEKIKIVSKYLTKVLSWRVWNHYMISQSAMEAPIYELCKSIREKSIEEIKIILSNEPIELPRLDNTPTLNQQNGNKLRVLLSLITEIVACNSGESDYMLNKKDIEVEHIWSNHFDKHKEDVSNESEFINLRNNIGGLLVLPKSFYAAYGADDYSSKVVQYFGQNILAQSLNNQKYYKNPGFVAFVQNSEINFKSYDEFKSEAILERANLYRNILKWNWK